jgi:hypothetical protein
MRSKASTRISISPPRTGVYKIDASTTTPYSRAVRLLGRHGSGSGLSGWFDNNSNVAYQVVWGYIDANNNTVLGDPSELINVTNNAGTVAERGRSRLRCHRDCQPRISGNSTARRRPTRPWSRACSSSSWPRRTSPPDRSRRFRCQLHRPDAGQPQGRLPLHRHHPAGPLQTNDPPPLCVDMCYWKNMMFYLNISSQQRAFMPR